MLTTGQIAHHASLSEKAVRLYADCGLLTSDRDPNNHRLFSEDQGERARRIALLRSLGLSLAEVRSVLDADDAPATFDGLWDVRRSAAAHAEEVGSYARSVLSGTPSLPGDLKVRRRTSPEQVVLRIRGEATLPQLPITVPELAQRLFDTLAAADAPLAGSLYVEFCSRATETFAAQLYVCAPMHGNVIRPPVGMEIVVVAPHVELFVGLRQAEADDQSLVVAVHDYLSLQYGSLRSGPNRDVYYPSFGTGATGEVMDVAVVVPGDVAAGLPPMYS